MRLGRQHQRTALLGLAAAEFAAAGEAVLLHGGVAQHLGVIVGVLLLARGVDDLQRMVGDHHICASGVARGIEKMAAIVKHARRTESGAVVRPHTLQNRD